jgi:uncharacterized protein (DUF697 family)
VALPIGIGEVRGLLKEVAVSAGDERPIAVSGALAEVLAKELARGGSGGAVRVTEDPTGAALFLHVVGRGVTETDEAVLKRAHRARVPIIAVAEDDPRVPYVLATDVVRLRPGEGFPIAAIAARIAHKLGVDGTALAARLPVLRGPVCAELVESFARKNGILGAAIFVPGADLPVMTLNQLRLILRIAAAHGQRIDRERLPEVLAGVGAGFGFRAIARELLDVVPRPAWLVKGAVAYAGTHAVGEASIRYFSARNPAGDGRAPLRPPPAAASRAAP